MSVLDFFDVVDQPKESIYHIWRRYLNPDPTSRCIHLWEKDPHPYTNSDEALAVILREEYHAIVLHNGSLVHTNGKNSAFPPLVS